MIRRIAFALSLGLGLALGLLWLLGSQNSVALADPGLLYVAPGGDCGGATPCFATVQDAVDAASAGAEIRVAAGAYTGVSARAGVTQTVYISKTVAIRGGYTTVNWTTPNPAANPATLDAQGLRRVLVITGAISPMVKGLRITGGDATGLGGSPRGCHAGGGVYVISATATISNNWVCSNTANWGGGLSLFYSDAMLNGNTVVSNTADYGCGLYLWSSPATLSGNTIISNSGDWAGGLYLDDSDATLSGNTIISNSVTYHGGGLFVQGSDVTLNGNTVISNIAGQRGGGLYLSRGDATLINNVVADNQASSAGSGLYTVRSSPNLLHTTIAHNSGGDGSGVYVTDSGSNCSTVAMTNTIISGHTLGITVTAGTTATLESTLWHSNTANEGGVGTINRSNDHSGDPAFVNPSVWDYHLTAGSAAIDKGVDAGVTTDIDGDVRPQGGSYDRGADEWGTLIYLHLPIVLRDHATP